MAARLAEVKEEHGKLTGRAHRVKPVLFSSGNACWKRRNVHQRKLRTTLTNCSQAEMKPVDEAQWRHLRHT
jgi:hypothetical protein